MSGYHSLGHFGFSQTRPHDKLSRSGPLFKAVQVVFPNRNFVVSAQVEGCFGLLKNSIVLADGFLYMFGASLGEVDDRTDRYLLLDSTN